MIAYKTSPAFKPKPEASRKKGGVDLGAMGIFFVPPLPHFPQCLSASPFPAKGTRQGLGRHQPDCQRTGPERRARESAAFMMAVTCEAIRLARLSRSPELDHRQARWRRARAWTDPIDRWIPLEIPWRRAERSCELPCCGPCTLQKRQADGRKDPRSWS